MSRKIVVGALVAVLAGMSSLVVVAAPPKDAKVLASWTVDVADSHSSAQDVVNSIPKYNDYELGVATYTFKTDTPGETKYLSSVKLTHLDRKGKKTEKDIPLADPRMIPESTVPEFVGLVKGSFYFTWIRDVVDTEVVGDTVRVGEIRAVNASRLDMRSEVVGLDDTATLADAEAITTTVGGVVVSVTGRIEDVTQVGVSTKGVFVSGVTAVFKDNKPGDWFCWGRTYGLDLVKIKSVMPDQDITEGVSVGYQVEDLGPKYLAMEKTTTVSATQRRHDVVVYRR